jgi:protein-tyrosine-phosphatase/DNA-binding transcriptional ArsR family regulator
VQVNAATSRAVGVPPSFLKLVAHPVRWRLLEALVDSDRAVRELADLIDEPQNLVSYHLRLLRDGGLVFARRSSADARDTYYAVDLARCRGEFRAAGVSLHPGLWPEPAPGATMRPPRQRVLFLCSGNSARSQIAEALIVDMSEGAIDALSAGSSPKSLHPNAVRVMRRRGIDISEHRTKHLDEFVEQRFDLVVTLCDRVREVCPEFHRHPRLVHWSIPDPSLEGSTNRASYPAFERTTAELETRIRFLLWQMNARPKRRPEGVGR